MKYKVGEEVRIVGRRCGHRFEIGEVVEVMRINENHNDYLASNKSGSWFIKDDEVKLVTPVE